MKPSALTRFLLRPYSEERSKICRLGWPIMDSSIFDPPLHDILMDTKDNYFKARFGTISATFIAFSSPRGFLSSTSLVICLFCK